MGICHSDQETDIKRVNMEDLVIMAKNGGASKHFSAAEIHDEICMRMFGMNGDDHKKNVLLYEKNNNIQCNKCDTIRSNGRKPDF